MEFGIFSQMHCPPWDSEHSRFMRELSATQEVMPAFTMSRLRGAAVRKIRAASSHGRIGCWSATDRGESLSPERSSAY